MVITLTSPLVNLLEQDISVTRKNLNSQQVIGRVKTFGPHQVQRKQPVLKGVSLVKGENKMPIRKTKGGYKIQNVKGKSKTKKMAKRRLRAIKASQAEKRKGKKSKKRRRSYKRKK